VLHERLGQSEYHPLALKAWVMESPMEAIELGGGPGSAAAGVAASSESTRPAASARDVVRAYLMCYLRGIEVYQRYCKVT
jgi:hypothetical protein